MEMTGYGIWLLAAELAMLAAPAVAVALSRGRLGRKAYAIRFGAAFLLWLVAAALAFEFLSPWPLLPVLALHLLIVRWTAMRLNDLQSTRWYALLWYFLPFGLALAIVLTAKRHRNDPVLF